MIRVGQSVLSLHDFSELLFEQAEIELNEAAVEKVGLNYNFLKKFSSNKLIYGINTGFGPMAQYRVNEENVLQLQYNLIRSHSSGSGKLMPVLLSKALMIARLNSFMLGYSGVHTEVVELLRDLINKNINPCIYEHGGVGASGDLVQLAHLGLVLIGEGEVLFEGEVHPTIDIFNLFRIKPLAIHIREGLAILNGTSAMTGIGMINIIQAKKLLNWAVLFSAMINEIVEAFDDHYSLELNQVKQHKGQNKVAAMMRDILQDSQMIRDRSEHLYNPDNLDQDVFEDKVQEYYSLRCVTQVLGPVYDTIEQAENVLVNELNSVNDNPVIDHETIIFFMGAIFTAITFRWKWIS